MNGVSVIVRFKEHMASASTTERGIINYVLENPEEAVQMSIHELARRSFVSASAVTRLCKKTGFQIQGLSRACRVSWR